MRRNLLNSLKCIYCDSSNLNLKTKDKDEILEGEILCKKCKKKYVIKEGVLVVLNNANTKEYGHWDEMYKARDDKKEIVWMENAFRDRKALEEYYAITHFLKNSRFNNSLEIGSGLGKYSFVLKKLGYVKEIVMVDISLPSLLITKKIFENFGFNCNLVLADAGNLPFKDKAFDLSFSGGLIEHFVGKKQEGIFFEHCRVAKDVLIQVPTGSFAYWLRRILLTIIKFGWPFGFEKPVGVKRIKELYSLNKYKLTGVYYHDFLTALIFMFSLKFKFLSKFVKKSFISRIFTSDLLIYGSS